MSAHPASMVCFFSCASCVGVLPVLSLTVSAGTPPACVSRYTASALPLMAAQCSGVHPSRSCRIWSASMNSSSRIESANPLYAAQCSGVRPSVSSTSASASHRTCGARRRLGSWCRGHAQRFPKGPALK